MLIDALIRASRRVPRKIAVDDGKRSLTYHQLMLLCVALRGVVHRQTSTQRVGIILPASAVFPATFFGVLWAGKIPVPLNFLLEADELTAIVEDAELDSVITIRAFGDLCQKLPVRVLYLEELSLKRRVVLASLLPKPKLPQVAPNDTAVTLYTSGTTGVPKGVELTYGNLHSNCTDGAYSLGLEQRQNMLNVLPPFHVFGLTANVLVPIYQTMTVHAIPRFSPVAMVKAVREHGIHVMFAIPSMYAAVLRCKSAKADAFRSVELAVSGGEPLPVSVRDGFADRFGISLHQGYGMTETSPVIAACSRTVHRQGTVGQPIRNARVRIATANGDEQPAGENGEIQVQGPMVMKGYLNQPAETRRVFTDDGWLKTGDVGSLDDDGFLRITGRAKEMLIIGGENVFPREIEAIIETFPGVVQAAVIGVPDDLRGEVAVAFVLPVANAELSVESIRNHVRRSLAGFKVPRRIMISDDLPMGPTGKIQKRKLTALLS